MSQLPSPLKLPTYSSWAEMAVDQNWLDALKSLNHYLADTLAAASAPVELNGNTFYQHKDANFRDGELKEQFVGKRHNLFLLAQNANQMLEVGVNGGHSLLLALAANPNLRCVGVDVCRVLEATWTRVDIYVPAAFRWLKAAFPGRAEFIKGNSLVALPQYALDHPNAKIDLVHLDGAKDTHLREFLALQPVLSEHAHVILDDTNNRPVQRSMRQIIRLGFARHVDNATLGLELTFGQRVLVSL